MKVALSDSLWPHGPYSPWNSPGQNTGRWPFPSQGIFLTQESNPGLPHCRWILYQLNHKGSPDNTRRKRKTVNRYGSMLNCFSCLKLCDLMDCSPPGFSVHGILQARILEWVAMTFSKGSSWPRDWTHISYISCPWLSLFFSSIFQASFKWKWYLGTTVWAYGGFPSGSVVKRKTILFYFLLLLFWSHAMWDLSSLTRDQTCTPCSGSTGS